jgi:hypothetical protein
MSRKSLFNTEIDAFIRTHYTQAGNYLKLADLVNNEFNASFTRPQLRAWCCKNGIKFGASYVYYKSYKPETLPIYSERIKPDNYTYIKLRDDKWILKHLWIWQQAHGEIPEDHHLIFLDSNKQNTNIENLMLVHSSVILYLNSHGMRYSDPELTKTAVAIAKLHIETYKKLKNKLGLGNKEFKSYIYSYNRKVRKGGNV